MASYVGIAGAAQGTFPNWTDGTGLTGSNGISSCSGVLSFNTKFMIASITDGTSNTMLVGEQSAMLVDTSNQPRQQWLAGGLYGWTMGFGGGGTGGSTLGTSDNRHFNCTTIRYAINDKKGAAVNANNGWPDSKGSNGVGSDLGCNSPLTSNHTGGVNVALGDGSVRFLRDSTPLTVLGPLCVKDDGQVFTLD
jgi:prepilin-type processing-associated H-X9-DG protein